MTDKRNYTGRIEDIVSDAEALQERVKSIKADFLNDKHRTHTPSNDDERANHEMAVYMLDKMIHALDTVIESNIMFNVT